MRILTVRQPWASAIIEQGKSVENRHQNIAGAYRGPVLIHAGLGYDEDAHIWVDNAHGVILVDEDGLYREPRGAIIGVVDLVDVHHASECVFVGDVVEDFDGQFVSQEITYCSPWAENTNVYHLVFENPRALDEPIPWKGGLGLRKVDNLEVIGDWLAEVEPECGRCAPPYGCPPESHATPIARLLPRTVSA